MCALRGQTKACLRVTEVVSHCMWCWEQNRRAGSTFNRWYLSSLPLQSGPYGSFTAALGKVLQDASSESKPFVHTQLCPSHPFPSLPLAELPWRGSKTLVFILLLGVYTAH